MLTHAVKLGSSLWQNVKNYQSIQKTVKSIYSKIKKKIGKTINKVEQLRKYS